MIKNPPMAPAVGPDKGIEKSQTDARAGIAGQGVRHVLIWSIFCTIVGLAVLYFFFFAS